MKDDQNTKAVDRRSFFRGLGGAAAVAGAAVATGAEPAAAQQENRDERRKARYRETEHVKNFYRTNRY
ncbi:MAG: formate dehydrogenase [Beijerinckiaceae bacterium]